MEREEYRQKAEWERARYIAKSIVSVQVAKKDRAKIDKAFALPWDSGEAKKEKVMSYTTPEEMAEIEAEMLRQAKKLR